jgi:hypothetical protein
MFSRSVHRNVENQFLLITYHFLGLQDKLCTTGCGISGTIFTVARHHALSLFQAGSKVKGVEGKGISPRRLQVSENAQPKRSIDGH